MNLSRWLHLFGIIAIVWISYLFGKTIVEHLEDFRSIKWTFSVSWFILATVLLIVNFILNAVGSQLSLSLFSKKVAFKPILAIRLVSDIGRYLPGKIWKFAGRAHFSSKVGVQKTVMVVASFIEEMSNLVSAGFLSLFALGSFGTFSLNVTEWIFFVLLIIIGIIFLYSSGLWNWCINRGLKILKRPHLHVAWTFGLMNKLIVWYFFLWVMLGVSFYCFIRAFTYVPLENIVWISSVFVAAWLISYLSFLTPGGIGIREGLLVFGLSLWIPHTYAIVISIASRLWIMLIEGGLALWGWYVLRRLPNIEISPQPPLQV